MINDINIEQIFKEFMVGCEQCEHVQGKEIELPTQLRSRSHPVRLVVSRVPVAFGHDIRLTAFTGSYQLGYTHDVKTPTHIRHFLRRVL